jgi:ABC-type Fe3+/spermidine/putrescine transport system ATPase subunit
MAARPIIEINNGSKVFGKSVALSDINLSINQGEILTLLDDPDAHHCRV